MTRKVRIEKNGPGIDAWHKAQFDNPKMIAKLTKEGQKLARKAGPGFEVKEMRMRRNRPGVIVAPVTADAMREQKKNNRLGKALGGG